MAGPTSLSLRATSGSSRIAENTPLPSPRVLATAKLTDRDGGQNLWSLEGADAGLFTLLEDASGRMSLALRAGVVLDFETRPVLDVVVRARDASAPAQAGVTASFTLKVGDVNEAPVITSDGGGATATVAVGPGQAQVTQVQAVDPEGAALRYSISGGRDASLFTLDAATGALAFKQAPAAGSAAVFSVQVTATESGLLKLKPLSDTQMLTVVIDQAPELIQPVHQVAADRFSFAVRDADSPSLQATLDGQPLATAVRADGLATVQTVAAQAQAQAVTGLYQVHDGRNTLTVTTLGLGTQGQDRLDSLSAEGSVLYGFDGADVLTGQDGQDFLVGGAGADLLNGGAGPDVFVYGAAQESNGLTIDVVSGVDFGGADASASVDRFHFAGLQLKAVHQLNVTGAQFANLAGTLAGSLGASEAVFLHVLNGPAQGRDFLFVDANGQAGFQAEADYAIEIVSVVNRAGLDLSDLMA